LEGEVLNRISEGSGIGLVVRIEIAIQCAHGANGHLDSGRNIGRG
jgi:hypothetical protein